MRFWPNIERFDVNENWAYTGIIKAGDFYFLSCCAGNVGQLLLGN